MILDIFTIDNVSNCFAFHLLHAIGCYNQWMKITILPSLSLIK